MSDVNEILKEYIRELYDSAQYKCTMALDSDKTTYNHVFDIMNAFTPDLEVQAINGKKPAIDRFFYSSDFFHKEQVRIHLSDGTHIWFEKRVKKPFLSNVDKWVGTIRNTLEYKGIYYIQSFIDKGYDRRYIDKNVIDILLTLDTTYDNAVQKNITNLLFKYIESKVK